MQTEEAERRIQEAIAKFRGLTGDYPDDTELAEIENAVLCKELPLPKNAFRLHRGFKGQREARDWQASCLRFHRSLRRFSYEPRPTIHTGTSVPMWAHKVAEASAYNFRKDTEVVAIWDGKEFRDSDGVPVVFGRNQWA